jgi:mRNA interferase MazF
MASKNNNFPLQGEIWLFDPEPVKGKELGKKVRPCLVISNNLLNRGSSDLVIVVPITSKDKQLASHIKINPPEGGVKLTSFAVSEQLRCVSKKRLKKKLGKLKTNKILYEVNSWISDILWID